MTHLAFHTQKKTKLTKRGFCTIKDGKITWAHFTRLDIPLVNDLLFLLQQPNLSNGGHIVPERFRKCNFNFPGTDLHIFFICYFQMQALPCQLANSPSLGILWIYSNANSYRGQNYFLTLRRCFREVRSVVRSYTRISPKYWEYSVCKSAVVMSATVRADEPQACAGASLDLQGGAKVVTRLLVLKMIQ